jgi:hypothetical protein
VLSCSYFCVFLFLIFAVISLFTMTLQCSAAGESSVPECKKAV